MGTMANELSLGCDCVGQIHYLVCGNARPVSAYLLTMLTAWFVRCTRRKCRHSKERHLHPRGGQWCPMEAH